jgi:hypothetical protein
MLNAPHPDDERLSALASRDDDAVADAALASHVTACVRCTDLVNELGALRTSLAELPDLRPSRPLRLLPAEADAPVAAGAAGWIRRLFAPALTVGAALAMVGLVGTTTPVLDGAAGGAATGIFEDVGEALEGGDGDSNYETLSSAGDGNAPAAEPGAERERDFSSAAAQVPEEAAASESANQQDSMTDEDRLQATALPYATDDEAPLSSELPAERSPWPMVLFAGVALMVGAALLRWILAPRTA